MRDRFQRGKDWQGQDLAGWLISEKFNGVRMLWDGEKAWTRQGREIQLPETWRAALPVGIVLDGELYHARRLTLASNAARYGERHFCTGMEFVVFDAPGASGNWPQRLNAARKVLTSVDFARVVVYWVADDTDAVISEMRAVQRRGGEGLMARHPQIGCLPGRTDNLLKIKKELPPCKQKKRAGKQWETVETLTIRL